MKNTFKVFGIIALLAVIAFSMAACGGGDDDSDVYDSSWNGDDISNWPTWEESRLYFRVTKDKQQMAINPSGSGDGKGTYIPEIFIILPDGKGKFPVGKWRSNWSEVEFTDKVFTRYWNGNPIKYNYTISGNYFLLTRLQ